MMLGGSSLLAYVGYVGSFDTTETWALSYWIEDVDSANQAFDFFQNVFSHVPDTPRYALDHTIVWECDYQLSEYNNISSNKIHGFVQLKTPPIDPPICPTPTEIKRRLNDKDQMRIEYYPPNPFLGGGGYYYGIIEISDNFNTDKSWFFRFDVRKVIGLDDAWDLFEKYIDSLSDESRKSEAKDYYWICKYESKSNEINKRKLYIVDARAKP
jgi:hypothetical protein